MKFLFIPLLCLSLNAVSQITQTGYSTLAIGAETRVYKKLDGELRNFTNTILDETNVEAQLYYGFTPSKYHQIRLKLY